MANKAFAIQSSALKIGGVELEAGTTTIVIPGVTQAANYRVEEVDETGEQTNALNLPIVIDNVTHVAKVADAGASVVAYATYSVELDDEDYIDEIDVNTAGTYVGSEVDRNGDFDMWGYTGSDAVGYLTNWVTGDWVQIPFRPKMRAGEVENIGGGGGGGVVIRDVVFPGGEAGDTQGTLADENGTIYYCTQDWTDVNDFNKTFEVDNTADSDVSQTGGISNSIRILAADYPGLKNILDTLNNAGVDYQTDFTVGGGDFGGAQTVTQVSYNGTTIDLLWPHRTGVDPTSILQGEVFTVVYTGTIAVPAIWIQLTSDIALDENSDLTLPGDITVGATGGRFIQDCDDNTTSIRWINVTQGSSTTEIIRVYTGDPKEDNEVERVQIKLNWDETEDLSGLTIRTFDDSDDSSEHDWLFKGDGVLQLPVGGDIVDSNGVSVLGGSGSNVDQNIWIETFASDVPSADFVQGATSVEYDTDSNVIALFSHYEPDPDSSYTSVAKLTPTGAVLWQVRFAANLHTDGWGLAYDGVDSVYVAGRTSGTPLTYEFATLTKIDAFDGTIVWSKTYDFEADSTSAVVDVDSDLNPVMVGYSYNGTDNYIITTKVDAADGTVIWSKTLDGQGDDQAYGMAVGPTGEVVTVGYIDEIGVAASHGVTPLTGSTIDVLVINRSDLAGDQLTDTWLVSGTGITETAGISEINAYTNLTGTVREGSGTPNFAIEIDGTGTIINFAGNGGTNYRVGHKILLDHSLVGGADSNADIIITVTAIDDLSTGVISGVSAAYFGTGGGAEGYYIPLSGTNYQTGSGLTFQFLGSGAGDYTGQDTFINFAGTNYVLDDVVTISGALLGGTSPENDMTVTINADLGAVVGFMTFTGTQQTATYRIIVPASSVDFGGAGTWTLSGTTVDQDDRMVVVKYATDGTVAWQKAVQFDAGYACSGADADIDSAGNIYVCGSYQYDLNPGTTSAMSLVKFNSSGVKQWSRRVVGDCDTFGTSVVVGDDDQLYLSGITANNNASDYIWVVAKYNTDGVVTWQRLIDNTTTWTFGGTFWFGGGGGSNIAVKNGYVALAGTFGDIGTQPIAVVLQIDTDATPFSVGDWDIKAATFSGVLNASASDIVVVDANKEASSVSPTVNTFASVEDLSNFLSVTRYGLTGGNNSLVNGAYSVTLGNTGTLTLPAGGTITEGYITSNPTIQLTPASPTVASQKLVIKGGGAYTYIDNGIEINYNNNTAIVGDTLTFYVYSTTYTDQTLYWWIYPQGAGIGDTESGTVVLTGNSGSFSILVDSDDYEFTVRVSPEADNYDPTNTGVESGLINADAPSFGDHHLHLTTGNLTETSIFLGTDNHNVRTNTDGSIKITTTTYGAVDRLNSSTSQGGYNTGTYTGLTTTGGSGTGLTVNATSTGGYIDFVTIVNPGTGYTDGDVLTLVGGDGLGCTLNIVVLGTSEWKFNAIGTTTFPTLTVPIEDNVTPTGTGQVLQFSDSTQQAIIFGPVSTAGNNSAERVIIQGAPGYAATAGEGGDVYVWAGPGGSANGGGGDIKVRAGEGIGSGQGGYLNFQAGDSSTGTGGYINIESGSSNTIGEGGYVDIRAQSGGDVNVYTGQAGTIGLNTEAGALTVGGVTAQVGSSLVIEFSDGGPGYFFAYGPEVLAVDNTGDINAAILTTFAAGSTITFVNGDVRTITAITASPGESLIDIEWTGAIDNYLDVPAFPIILKTANYAAEVIAPTSIAVSASTWTFAANGSTTLPGAITRVVAGTVAKTGVILPTTTGIPLTLSGTMTGLVGTTYDFSYGGGYGAWKATDDGAGNLYLIFLFPAQAQNQTVINSLAVGDSVTIEWGGQQHATTIAGAVGPVPNDPYLAGHPDSVGFRLTDNFGETGQQDRNVGSINFIKGTYGPFTRGGVTFSVTVAGGGISGFIDISSTTPYAVNASPGTLTSEDLGDPPGQTTNINVISVVQETPTALDLTKSVNKLTNGVYTLADGVEGQIMYLVRQTGAAYNLIRVNVANARVDGGAETTIDYYPFETSLNMSTLIFTDGAWQASVGGWD